MTAVVKQHDFAKDDNPPDTEENIKQLSEYVTTYLIGEYAHVGFSILTRLQAFVTQKAKQSYLLGILRSADDQVLIRQYGEDIKSAVVVFGVSRQVSFFG